MLISVMEVTPEYDLLISNWLYSKAGKGRKRDKGVTRSFGIEAPSGNIYRIITTTGMADYLEVCDLLFMIGLNADDTHIELERGVTDIFRP